MTQKTYAYILKVGLYLSFVSVFLVNKNYLFPYITSKQIYFNVLIELMVIIWVALLVKYPEWRPKKSYISLGLVAYLLAMITSGIFGVDWNLSFWGDIERMLGAFHVLHFLFFYFIIITVMRTGDDWKYFLTASVAAATINSFYGMAIHQAFTTIGNTAYVSGYFLFNIYFAIFLIIKEKNLWFRSAYILAILPMFYAFWNANTSGAQAGLISSLLFAGFLSVILGKNKKVRLYSLIGLSIFVLFLVFVFVNRDRDFLRDTQIGIAARDLSFQKRTFQTRLISWRGAWKDFKNHPILGVGHGNYAIIFDKYFVPEFYNYTKSETYFDRAHNNIVDIASTTGIVGLLTYLSIFLAAAYYLIKAWRQGRISLAEFVLTSGVLIAYFVQNLAVFDSLVTYLCLMVTLGYVYWLSGERVEKFSVEKSWSSGEMISVGIIAIMILGVAYQYNYKPHKMLVETINGQRSWAQSDVMGAYRHYQEALSYHTPLDRDSRSTFIRLFSNGPTVLNKLEKNQAEEIINFALELAQKNIELNPHDSMMQLEFSQLLITVSGYYYSNDKDKFQFYIDQAMEHVNLALEASPMRIPVYYIKAQIYLMQGKNDEAIETLKYAESLNDTYFDSPCQLANTYLYFRREEEGFKEMDKCLALNGMELLSPEGYVKNLISHYLQKEDWENAMKLYVRLTTLTPNDANAWADLAKIYLKLNDKENAKAAALKAAEANPGFQSAVEDFIANIDRQ